MKLRRRLRRAVEVGLDDALEETRRVANQQANHLSASSLEVRQRPRATRCFGEIKS